MKLRRAGAMAGVLAVLVFALGACGDDGDGPASVPDDRELVDAPIDDLNLISTGERPTRYQVVITSGLPNSCAEFHDAEITSKTDTVITVRITNTVPKEPDVECAEVYSTHTSLLDLGSNYTQGTTYTVKVNDADVKFAP